MTVLGLIYSLAALDEIASQTSTVHRLTLTVRAGVAQLQGDSPTVISSE